MTQDPADDREPKFSPDGSRIAFRSDREGSGVYVAPALGGEARLIAKDGQRPRFFPDGQWIVYWVGNRSTGDPSALNVGLAKLEPWVARDSVEFNLAETAGNIWIASLESRR